MCDVILGSPQHPRQHLHHHRRLHARNEIVEQDAAAGGEFLEARRRAALGDVARPGSGEGGGGGCWRGCSWRLERGGGRRSLMASVMYGNALPVVTMTVAEARAMRALEAGWPGAWSASPRKFMMKRAAGTQMDWRIILSLP